VSGEVRNSERSGSRYINWRLQVSNGEFKGKTLYLTTSLKPEALWNLRNLIHAATTKNVAGKAVSFDPDTIVGKVVAITTVDDEYEGKIRSTVQDVRPKDELETEEDEEEEGDEEEEEEEELEDVDLDEV
jgi:hypothetical protein